jgi:Cu(I)/Ag(I) efflux system membrane protein CusA/SilA
MVLILGLLIAIYGSWTIYHLPVDVFPDLSRPTVTILTEAHGLAPEEVETLVTAPIEAVLNGTSGVLRIRSTSGIGLSIVFVEFDWGTEVYRNRQLIAERLQLVQNRLPKGILPMMGPVNSLMGEIQMIGLTSPDGEMSAMDLRTLADWTIRPRLMTVPGVSQVIAMGGEVKQYQIMISTERLQKRSISLEELKHALSEMSDNTTGGFVDIGGKEFLIRPLARVTSVEDIENSLIGLHLGKPVLVKDIAKVQVAPRTKRGDASINGKHAVILTIQKQPSASTLDITKKVEAELAALAPTLPKGVIIEKDLFKQAHFIETAINNVEEALRDGILIVAVIVFLFLLNLRTTVVTLVVIPLSLLMTAVIFRILGMSINTMTLGGLAIAIGELVDDAIVDVENVYRRLREERLSTTPRGALRVIYEASSEVRNSIVYSTIIVVLVFIPLFALSGIEGKLFVPLGIAYMVSILASLVISLTVTPVLCSFVLPSSKSLQRHNQGPLIILLQRLGRWVLARTLGRPVIILFVCMGLLAGSLRLLPKMGRNFLPTFNEGTATIGIALAPGVSLAESDRVGMQVEQVIMQVPEVKSTVRRTGRAEMDEHVEGVHWSEIDVDFRSSNRSRTDILQDIRQRITAGFDVYVNVGQPISHRLDHLLSGVRAQIALKVFGPDLSELRRVSGEIQDIMRDIPGIVDLQGEPLTLIPQLKIGVNREEANRYGIRSGELAADLESTLSGSVVGQFLAGQRSYDIFMRLDETSRSTPEKIAGTLVKFLPSGKGIQLKDVSQVYQGMGPNMINREDLMRRIVVLANASGRDLAELAKEIMTKVSAQVPLPEGYFFKLDGQFASQERAMRLITILGAMSIVGILVALYVHFRSWVLTLQVILNVPLALIGGIVAIYLTERTLSVATLIAFITLCGISTRNGIMMITHYLHLMKAEGEEFSREMVIRGTLERLVPVLMTALTAACALVPLLFGKGEPGKEILYPVAVVIVGGLLSSTLLDLVVTPALFLRFGQKGTAKYLQMNTQPYEEELL